MELPQLRSKLLRTPYAENPQENEHTAMFNWLDFVVHCALLSYYSTYAVSYTHLDVYKRQLE